MRALYTYLRDDLIAVATVLAMLAALVVMTAASYTTAAGATNCQEDQPCWDGTRMGNRQVGATVVDHEADGSPIVSCPKPQPLWVGVNDTGRLVCQY